MFRMGERVLLAGHGHLSVCEPVVMMDETAAITTLATREQPDFVKTETVQHSSCKLVPNFLISKFGSRIAFM